MTDAPPPVQHAVLDDLRARLRSWRPVAGPGADGWQRGADPTALSSLVERWWSSYDWREHESVIRSWPWSVAGPLRVLRFGAGGTPVVLLHGWPDSVLRFSRAWPLLDDVSLVVPALPGYPFALPGPAMSSSDMATAVAAAMAALGHDRFVVSGGDVGSSVAVALAARHPERVAALHLTDVRAQRDLAGADDFRDAGRRWQRREGAYLLEQATKPHTLMVGLGDSPAGLAAWIVEKLHGWSADLGAWSTDELLTWVTAYWVDGCIGTSFGPYTLPSTPVTGRLEVPTVVTQFPGELVRAPRSVAEAAFDLRVWQEPEVGGHFGAWEEPEAFVAGVRATLDLV